MAAEYAILSVGIIVVVGVAVATLMDPTNSAFVVMGSALTSGQASLTANLP